MVDASGKSEAAAADEEAAEEEEDVIWNLLMFERFLLYCFV